MFAEPIGDVTDFTFECLELQVQIIADNEEVEEWATSDDYHRCVDQIVEQTSNYAKPEEVLKVVVQGRKNYGYHDQEHV